MRGWKKALLLVVTLLIAAGIYLFLNQKKALRLIVPEVNKVENIRLKVLKDSINIRLMLEVRNAGIFRIHIDSLHLSLTIDTSRLISENLEMGLVLEPGGQDQVPFDFCLAFEKLREQIRAAQSKDSVQVQISGHALYSTILGKVKMPVHKRSVIPTPRPPKIEVKNLRVESWDLENLDLVAELHLVNPGRLKLNLYGISYQIKVADLFEIEEKKKINIGLSPHQIRTYELPMLVHLQKPLLAAWKVITNNDLVPYRLRISAILDLDTLTEQPVPIEVEKQGRIELRK